MTMATKLTVIIVGLEQPILRRELRKLRAPKINFVGETADMNGHVFQTFNESQNKRKFTKTVETLQRYVNKNGKYAGDLAQVQAPGGVREYEILDVRYV